MVNLHYIWGFGGFHRHSLLIFIYLFKKHFCPGVGVLGGQLYAAGGHDGPLVRKSVEVYDPQTNTWRLVCDMNMCRRNAGQTAVTASIDLFIVRSG